MLSIAASVIWSRELSPCRLLIVCSSNSRVAASIPLLGVATHEKRKRKLLESPKWDGSVISVTQAVPSC